jgi:hypothetical protein
MLTSKEGKKKRTRGGYGRDEVFRKLGCCCWLAGWLAGSGTEKQQSADLRFSINRHIDGYTLVIRVNNAYAYI